MIYWYLDKTNYSMNNNYTLKYIKENKIFYNLFFKIKNTSISEQLVGLPLTFKISIQFLISAKFSFYMMFYYL